MSKKNLTILMIIGLIIVGGISIDYFQKKSAPVSNNTQCRVEEMTFYYLDQCGWCQKVKNEGTLEKIEKLGVKIKRVDANIGPIKHKFQGVPTFVIDEEVYSGYKTFDELRELLVCSTDSEQNLKTQNQAPPLPKTAKPFLGEKGEKAVLENGEIKLNAEQFNDNQARFYNIEMSGDKIIHFFVVKDKNGIYRAAADACQVCFGERKGLRQEGDEIICNNCGNRYPIEKIATEKGGCNPGPINPNLEVKDEKIIIKQADIEQVANLF